MRRVRPSYRKETQAKVTQYERGKRFEYATRNLLRGLGYDVIRSAGSKGAVDLVAIPPGDGDLIFLQLKLSDPVIPPAERIALMGLALRGGALPVVAYKGEEGRSRPILFRELTGPGPFEFRAWTPTTEENEG